MYISKNKYCSNKVLINVQLFFIYILLGISYTVASGNLVVKGSRKLHFFIKRFQHLKMPILLILILISFLVVFH